MRKELIPEWSNPLEFTFMLFDDSTRKLTIVSSAMVGDGEITHLDKKSKIEFGYGEGIAGKAFKGNEIRMYVDLEVERRTTPSHYRPHAGQEPDAVLLAFPLRSPNNPGFIFGVFNVTSNDPMCPLARALDVTGSITKERLLTFQTALNICVINTLQTLADEHII